MNTLDYFKTRNGNIYDLTSNYFCELFEKEWYDKLPNTKIAFKNGSKTEYVYSISFIYRGKIMEFDEGFECNTDLFEPYNAFYDSIEDIVSKAVEKMKKSFLIDYYIEFNEPFGE